MSLIHNKYNINYTISEEFVEQFYIFQFTCKSTNVAEYYPLTINEKLREVIRYKYDYLKFQKVSYIIKFLRKEIATRPCEITMIYCGMLNHIDCRQIFQDMIKYSEEMKLKMKSDNIVYCYSCKKDISYKNWSKHCKTKIHILNFSKNDKE